LKAELVQRARVYISPDNYAPEVVGKWLSELKSEPEIERRVRSNVRSAEGYGHFSAVQSVPMLALVPFQELYRAEEREEWRDWPQRWEEQGGKFYEGASDYADGRMVAPTNSTIWDDLANPENYQDGTGDPYAPLAFGSGMRLRAVSHKDALALGLHPKPQTPKVRGFNASIEFAADVDDDIAKVLNHSLTEWNHTTETA